jgi:hypothetical protein
MDITINIVYLMGFIVNPVVIESRCISQEKLLLRYDKNIYKVKFVAALCLENQSRQMVLIYE